MELTQEQIEFLDLVCLGKWTLNSDGEVDVDGSVTMSYLELTEIPVKFGRVAGNFHCSNNKLTTLKNCPDWIVDGQGIMFQNNNLTEYFKNIKEEDFPLWKNLIWKIVLNEYPFLINSLTNFGFIKKDLKWYLKWCPITKLYYRD